MEINHLGKSLILLGVALVIIGGLLSVFNKVPLIGHLPGDIHIKKENFSFYFPLTSCILISIILSLLLSLWRRF